MIRRLIILIPFALFFLFCCGNQQKTESKNEHVPENDSNSITIISIYDNYKVKSGLETNWGFSALIKTGNEQILFDTGGNPKILLSNMKKLGIKPDSIDKIFISHIHGDHSGGLKTFLEHNSDVLVFIPKSFPISMKNMITEKGAEYTEISKMYEISDNVYSTGELSGPPTEQSLVIKSENGIIVMTGCAHPGIARIVKRAKEMMKEDKVYLVVGGFHQPPKSAVKEFREIGVEKVAPSHCTGDAVKNAFAKEYKKDFIENGVGKEITIYQE